MELEIVEFKLALEIIIFARNENGATLSEILGDYYDVFGITFESMFGSKWSEFIRNLLLNEMDNVAAKDVDGCTLYFTNIVKFREKLLAIRKTVNIERVLQKLNIDPKNIRSYTLDKQEKLSFNSNVLSSASGSSNSSSKTFKMVGFYNHTFIADNFFLELSNIDLRLPKSKNNEIECIGLCISGQTMKSAFSTITYNSHNFLTKNVILNIGTFDLLNGRTDVNLVADIVRLLNALKRKNLDPILTTLAPMPGSHGDIEERRQSLNKFIRQNFNYIDIESCFLSNEKRVLLECYQLSPKPVGGSKHPILLWNRVGRQRVLQLMKREIPYIHPIF